jgi:hypothetical protein
LSRFFSQPAWCPGVVALVYLTAAGGMIWSQVVQSALIMLVTWVLGDSTRHG